MNKKPSYPPPYTVIDGSLYQEIVQGKSKLTKKLCNFVPYLIAEVVHDDGAELKRFYRIGAAHADGYSLPEVSIPESDFAAMNWIGKFWGSCCNPSVGQSVRDNIRFAILATAEGIERETIYAHLGWAKIDGKWQYLIPGGDFNVCLDGNIENYRFQDGVTSCESSKSFALISSGLAPDEITFPLLAVCYLSPLNEFLRQAGCEPKTLLALIGKTGSKKSTLAALFLSHFGSFTMDRLPLSFRDTANSILHRLFALKDVPTVVDDFHPSTRKEEIGMTATFQMLTRAFGDKTARGRMRADLTLETPRPPRGNGIITAEFAPDISESGTARYFELELAPNSVNMSLLTEFQQAAADGALQQAMRSYIEYLKTLLSDEKAFVASLSKMFSEQRRVFRDTLISADNNCHDRLPDACAWLMIGFQFAIDYFIARGVLLSSNGSEYIIKMRSCLLLLAQNQSKKIYSDKPSEKFLHKLFSLVDSGTVSISERMFPADCNHLVGYQDENYIYLIKDAAHKAVRKLCDEQGESFSVSSSALLTELENDGLLERASNGERTRSVKVGGTNKRLMLLFKNKVAEIVGVAL